MPRTLTPADQAERARKLKERIAQQVKRAAGKGLNAARLFLEARVKEALSAPAPRKRVLTRYGYEYRATTRALPGAPPRKLSGKLRQSVTSRMEAALTGMAAAQLTAVVGVYARSRTGFDYPRFHEVKAGGRSGQHPFLAVTAEKYRRELRRILGQEFRGTVR